MQERVRNQGMSLTELLVAVAVLGIAMTGVFALINLSARYYSHSSREVEVQSELQTAFTMVSNMIVDANVEVKYTTSTKTAEISNSTTKYVVMLVGKKLYARIFDPASTAYTDIEEDQNLLADHVDEFAIDTTHYDDGYVVMSMKVSYGSREAEMSKNVFLRNSAAYAGTFTSNCTSTSEAEPDGKVKYTIKNKGTTISSGKPVDLRFKLNLTGKEVKKVTADSGCSVTSYSYNAVTGILTVHCKTSSQWLNDGTISVKIQLKSGALTTGQINLINVVSPDSSARS